MHSCIYEGTVRHRRFGPVNHQFQYRLFMLYLELGELDELVGTGGPIARSRYAGCAFLRSDHLFHREVPLEEELREIVRQQTGTLPTGQIRLLTQLRYFGYYFSPLNLFYVFDDSDRNVEFVVAEVNNTPWKERHCYVLWRGNRSHDDSSLQFMHPKEFHVSPFMGMEMNYRWRLGQPGQQLNVQLANLEGSRRKFDASMALQRRELTRSQLRRMTLRYPMMTVQIMAAIHIQALKLWWKKCPFHVHPKKTASNLQPSSENSKQAPIAKIATR